MTPVIIGRFQVPYLHLGHIHLITQALLKSPDVIILLGVSPRTDDKNPYDFRYRSAQIKRLFPQVAILPLADVPGDDKAWSFKIDVIASNLVDAVLFHSRDSFKDHYSGKFPLYEVEEIPGFSGTELRNQTT